MRLGRAGRPPRGRRFLEMARGAERFPRRGALPVRSNCDASEMCRSFVSCIIIFMSILNGKQILLGVTGSIAAYKAADLASKLTQQGARVDVILTGGAQKFVTPLTFQSVTGHKAYTDED